jgi:hypothetical protein
VTVLPTYGGPTKRALIKRAFAECGQADYNYQIEPEEYDQTLDLLNGLMLELKGSGIDLSYNQPTSNVGSPNDESGIPFEATQAIGLLLAECLAPTMGKTLSNETNRRIARSRSLLRGQYATIPSVVPQSTTPRGSGNRWFGLRRPYFPATDPDDTTNYGFSE